MYDIYRCVEHIMHVYHSKVFASLLASILHIGAQFLRSLHLGRKRRGKWDGIRVKSCNRHLHPSPEFSSVIFPCRRCRHDHTTKGTYKKAILPGRLRVAEFKRLLSERHALLSPHSDQHVVYTVHTNTQLTVLTRLFWAREVLHVHSYEFPILYT